VEKHVLARACRAFVACCLAAAFFPVVVTGGGLKEARLTQSNGEVTLNSTDESGPHQGLPDAALPRGAGLTTGANSRAELSFNNHVIVRLSANAVFNFKKDLELTQGAILIQAPGGAKGKVHAGDVAVDVTNAIAVIEYQAPAFKFLVLEGTVRLYRPSHLGDSILVRAGQMIFGSTKDALADPVDFEIERFVRTCPLIRGFGPLPSEKLLAAASARQQEEKSKKGLIDTNLVIFGGGSNVSVVNSVKKTEVAASAQNSASKPRPSTEEQP